MAKRRKTRGASRAAKSDVRGINGSGPNKVKMVIQNFVVFLVLFILSFILYEVTKLSASFWNDLFFLLSMIFGFISLALFISWLILLLVKVIRKSK